LTSGGANTDLVKTVSERRKSIFNEIEKIQEEKAEEKEVRNLNDMISQINLFEEIKTT
jgi:hypothetical protein